jgi:hypothetical protein
MSDPLYCSNEALELFDQYKIPDNCNAFIADACWAVYLMCNFAHMRYLSEPLRHGEEHCVAPEFVYIPADIEAMLDVAIRMFKPGEPSMRNGNRLFGSAKLVFGAEQFKFEPQ